MQVIDDEATDEMAPYFSRESTPKVVIVGESRPCNVSLMISVQTIRKQQSSIIMFSLHLTHMCIVHA